ncbi:MAG: leucine-rich repeat protein [Lachnospiraceae bacterium]|nr:leucine-rich repeat protein [Lachnospiraceae bacterium]
MLIQEKFEIENGILTAYHADTAQEITIPEGVYTIGEGVFKGMSWIRQITLPAGLRKIEPTAFKGCRQMKKIIFPEGLEEIGEYAFHKCHELEEVVLPASLTTVGDCAFLYCDGLKCVVAEGPKRLGKAAFSHNLSLREISLNANLDDSNFSEEVFEGCVNLKRITLSGEVFEVENLIGAMDSHSGEPRIIKSIAKSVYHSMQIEDGVLSKFSINLKKIVVPKGITAIGKSCFFDKKGVVSISLPASLKEIRANAFLNCIGLTEVTFQSGEVSLDDKAFRGCCNLKKVKVAGEEYLLEEIGVGAAGSDEHQTEAGHQAASSITNDTVPELVSRIRDQVLGDFYISGKILVRYMGNEEQIRIPKGVEIIGERCFFGKEQLRTVLCPESLTEIREQAFAGCVTLQNIVLPANLKRVEREAFAECKKLLKCNLPLTTEYIGEYAFRRCFLLKPFAPWPENATIHPYAFYRAPELAEYGLKRNDNSTYCVDERIEQSSASSEEVKENFTNSADDHASSTIEADGSFVTEAKVIPPYAHSRENNIRSLTLSDVERIGKYAFSSCPDLEEIEIDSPDCVIEQNAFSTCPKLKRVRLNVKSLGKAAFAYCRELADVSLAGVSELPAECFAGCYGLKKLDIGKKFAAIGDRCFDECLRLDEFDFSGIGVIGERAFERCDSLKSVKLGRVECGFHAFADCASLENIEITRDTVLKSGVFIGCTQVKTVTFDGQSYEFSRFADSLNHTDNHLPMAVREMIASVYLCFDIREKTVLAGYSQDATRVTVPADITQIGQDVFRDHSRLEEIRIPESVRLFGSHAFSMTAWLEGRRAGGELVIQNGVLIDGALCRGNVILPAEVQRVASWCFAGNTQITGLVIPSERLVIEHLAFRNCLNLKRITDADGKEYVLRSVEDLQKKTCGSEGSVCSESEESVCPESKESVCSESEGSAYDESEKPAFPELIHRIFSECINCFKLDNECNLIESTGNITALTFPEGIRAVGDNVYKDCHLLERIELCASTVAIGKCSFENSKWLKVVSNAGAVKRIGMMAFSGCQSLATIDLSDALEELGNRCFEHCGSLTEIYLSENLTRIPERAFFRCKALTTVRIPQSVKVIEAEAFAFCEGLKEVWVPEGTSISEGAFAYCDGALIRRY